MKDILEQLNSLTLPLDPLAQYRQLLEAQGFLKVAAGLTEIHTLASAGSREHDRLFPTDALFKQFIESRAGLGPISDLAYRLD